MAPITTSETDTGTIGNEKKPMLCKKNLKYPNENKKRTNAPEETTTNASIGDNGNTEELTVLITFGEAVKKPAHANNPIMMNNSNSLKE